MLDTLSIGNENNVLQNYVFSYDRLPLPSKESFQFDYWGYYNGVSTSGQDFEIAPSALVNYYAYDNDLIRFFHGRDRRSDINYIQRGILKSIKYPTGGTTSFNYEMNEFSNTFVCSQKKPTIISNAYYFYDEDEPDDEGARQEYGYDFEITGSSMSCLLEVHHYLRYTSRFDYTSDHICSMPSHVCIEKKGVSGYSMVTFFDIVSESGRLSDGNPKTDKFIHTFSSPGTYRIRIIPESYEPQPDIYVEIQNAIDYEIKQVDSGGGLRVKQVTDSFSIDQSITKKYYYQDGSENSSGLLMTDPQFHCVYAKESQLLSGMIYGDIVTGTLHMGNDLYFGGFSSPFRPFGNSAMGAHVGYSTVEEIVEVNGQNNGKIKYTFHNAIDDTTNLGSRFIRNFPTIPNLNNGNLITVTSYNDQNIEIKKDSFEYEKLYETSIKGLKFMNTPMELITNLYSPDGWNDIVLELTLYDNVAFKFYDLYSERWQLTKKTISELFDGKWVTNIGEYNYNDENWLPNHIKTHESTAKFVEIITTYSVDSHTAMKNRGILSAVTEQSTKINNQLTQKIVTDYKNWGNNLFAPEFVKVQTGTQSAPETRLTYHNYDSKGNPLYVSKDGANKTVYLWGYNHQYPIAEIQNATYDQVKNALGGQTVVDGIANADTLSVSNATLINNLRTNSNLLNAMVTTYTYKPLVGMHTATDPRDVTTYYEYDHFGRLKRIYLMENSVDKTIQRYDYHYKNQ
jgi:hypothetical protein